MRQSSFVRGIAFRFAILLLGAAVVLSAKIIAAQDQPAEKKPLLADTHKALGLDCLQCHIDKPGSPVQTATCTGCHNDIEKPEKARSGLPNPHNAHMEFPDCSQCHHAHKSSENQCGTCHKSEYKIP